MSSVSFEDLGRQIPTGQKTRNYRHKPYSSILRFGKVPRVDNSLIYASVCQHADVCVCAFGNKRRYNNKWSEEHLMGNLGMPRRHWRGLAYHFAMSFYSGGACIARPTVIQVPLRYSTWQQVSVPRVSFEYILCIYLSHFYIYARVTQCPCAVVPFMIEIKSLTLRLKQRTAAIRYLQGSEVLNISGHLNCSDFYLPA